MEKGASMEESKSFGFNRKRAEGRDNSDVKKKELQLKVRKLNPINTISYVQVSSILNPAQIFWLCSILLPLI